MSEFGAPHTLVTPAGSITFNPGAGGDGYYLSEVVGLDGANIRNPVDDIPQTDGSFVHPFFRSGLVVTYRGFFLATAGTTTRRGFEDNLKGYTDRLLRPTAAELVSQCRMKFTPSGANERMLDQAHLFSPVIVTGGWLKSFEFTLASPYHYLLDSAQSNQAISAGGSQSVSNGGNTRSYPVIQVNATAPGVANGSSFSTATITNTTTGDKIVFSAGAAAGHYIEVDCFKRTAYLDGSGANELSEIDWTQSTFFSLVAGSNTITSTGAPIVVLWNNAWAGS